MIYQLLVTAFCAAIVVHCKVELNDEEVQAIRERFAEYEGMQKSMRSIFLPEESRDSECLKEGAVCDATHYFPPCCGARFRCVFFDHEEESYPGGPKIWISNCRRWL